MDSNVIAAIISAVGTILAGLVGALFDKKEAERAAFNYLKLAVYLIVIALVIGGGIWFYLYDGTRERIRSALPVKDGYQKVIYEKIGVGLSIPSTWRVNDISYHLGGGQIMFVRDSDPQSGQILQGMTLRLFSLEERDVENPHQAAQNRLATIKKLFDKNASLKRESAAGLDTYTVEYIEPNKYSVHISNMRLTRRVMLEVTAFGSLDEGLRNKFEAERNQIRHSIVIDPKRKAELEERERKLIGIS